MRAGDAAAPFVSWPTGAKLLNHIRSQRRGADPVVGDDVMPAFPLRSELLEASDDASVLAEHLAAEEVFDPPFILSIHGVVLRECDR